VYAEPEDLDRAEVARALAVHWGIAAPLRYLPVGFGTHHYRTGDRWFVNVDEPGTQPDLERALATAAALRDAGLEFVHAPRPRAAGGYVAVLAGGYAVSVYAFLDGTAPASGAFPTDAERHTVLATLGRLHATTPATMPRRDDLAITSRSDFAALDLTTRWTGGPFAEPARELVAGRRTMIDDRFAAYDALVPAVRATADRWVVTHGEPHAGNVLWLEGGGFRFIDWDTVAVGPPERDLWVLQPRSAADRAAYGRGDADPTTAELYRLRWWLTEVCVYATGLHGTHVDDANTRESWRELREYLAAG
jgi:spectinomycin phosphotransferase